jgi:Protein of unknown function (DUF2854)
MLGKISLGTLGLTVGGILTIMGFIAYAADNATLNLVGFFYGFPLLLGGLALKANELKPILPSQPTTPEISALREQQATITQNQIRKDITRFCYGQDAHFDRALSFLGLNETDEERPDITGFRETEIDGAYALVLEFDSPLVPMSIWQEKHEKMTKYFAPGVDVKITQPEEERIELMLVVSH